MFTANYDLYRKIMFVGENVYSSSPMNVSKGFVRTSGAELETNYGSASASGLGNLGYWISKVRCAEIPTGTVKSAIDAGFGTYLGSGATPASKDDYTLENPITSGLQISNFYAGKNSNFVYTEDEAGNQTFAAPCVVTNTTEAEINVYEIGIITPVSSNGSTFYFVLMERTVLTEPITLLPGEPKLIQISVKINQTLNVE